MQFDVRAFEEASQQIVSLRLDASDEAGARAQVEGRGLKPLSIAQAASWAPWGVRRRAFDVALFIQELHTLTQAGLTLVESLEALLEKETQDTPKAVLGRLLASLREGHKLSDAMRRAGSEVFPPLLAGIVQAAENTGDLSEALERYLAYDQRVQSVRQRIVSAAIYPVVLCVVGALVALFLMTWVVPRFAAVYRGTGRALPWGSQLLLDWGQLVNHYGWAILGGGVAVVGLAVAGTRAFAARHGWHSVLSRIPGVSRWISATALARLYLTLGLLLRGGLPIQQALTLVRSVLPQRQQPAVDEVMASVARGLPLSQALESARLSSPIALRFVRAGERSGQLSDMLTRSALYHDAETARWVDRFSRLFEPLLMTLIGLVIGVIVLLLYMPVFDLAGSLQ